VDITMGSQAVRAKIRKIRRYNNVFTGCGCRLDRNVKNVEKI
jgi:hypothetical protein